MPPADIGRHPFVKSIARALRRRCGVRRAYTDDQITRARETIGRDDVGEGPSLLVAVSGGADSVALWRALCALAPRRNWRLHLQLAHVNHKQRPEADREADFVASLAAHHSPLDRAEAASMTMDLDPAYASGNLEASMRRQRYAALREMAHLRRADHVVTAHHADDQLETVLMRLMRGASAGGLAGMAWQRRLFAYPADHALVPVHCSLIRPMLAVTHEDVVRFLRDIGQPWCEDPTNRDATRWRARLRRDVLPALKALRADVPHKAVALGEHLRDVRRLIQAEARRCDTWIVRSDGTWTLPRPRARRLNRAVLIAVCRRLLIEAGVPRDALRSRALQPVVRAIRDGRGGERTFDLPGGAQARVTRDAVMFTSNHGCPPARA